MNSPELLLKNLNQSLRALRGASAVLDGPSLDEELRPVMQRLLLAEVLGELSIIAIGGSQGAGKTTLLAKLYGLSCDESSWLNANEGRGEQLPVLILEDQNATTAQGYQRRLVFNEQTNRYELVEEPVKDARAFRNACGGGDSSVLLPILRVPPKFFAGTRQALMLLPGYERATRENNLWQTMMRQVMIGSAGCVIVTDSTRLANQQQQEILRDTLQSDLETLDTLVVVTKTEEMASNTEKLQGIRAIAAQTFDVSEPDRRVITAGVTDADYVKQWMPALEVAIRQLGASTVEHRNAQLSHLEETIGTDLGRVLSTVQSRARTYLASNADDSDNDQTSVKRCLDAFDASSRDLREKYRRQIGQMLRTRTGDAWDDLQERLKNDHEGFLTKVKNFFDTATEGHQKLQADIAGAWNHGEPVSDAFIQIVTSLVEARLGAQSLPIAAKLSNDVPVPQRLGYADDKGNAVAWRKLSDTTINDLKALFCQINEDDTKIETSKELENNVKLLPALALEYVRAASLVPGLVRLDEHGVQAGLNGDLMTSLTNVRGQLQAFQYETSTILKGLAVVMAIDFFADGQLDSVAPLLKVLGLGAAQATEAVAGGATTAASTAATAMTAVSAIGAVVATAATVGFLVYAGMREVRHYDNQVRSYAFAALQGIQDLHERHFMSHFDDLMGHLRDRLTEGLRRRFHLDKVLMRQDRLAKAIADVKQYRLDLLDEIARSGKTLDIYRGLLAA
jgi:energy-coupling factor transporter ATP-binding protein EcfA2